MERLSEDTINMVKSVIAEAGDAAEETEAGEAAESPAGDEEEQAS